MDKQRRYTLKNGVVLYQHATGKSYTNVNLTDAVAEDHLRKHPQDVQFFATYEIPEPEKVEEATEPEEEVETESEEVETKVEEATEPEEKVTLKKPARRRPSGK